MNSPVFGLRVASVLFGLVCLAHVGRVIIDLEIRVGSFAVGRWPGLLAALVMAALSAWMWHLARVAGRKNT